MNIPRATNGRRVAEVGPSVDEFAVGDDVAIEAHHGCGRCDNCLVGKYTACLNYGNPAKGQRATGMTTDGGFAQYAVHHVELALQASQAPIVQGCRANYDSRHGTVSGSTSPADTFWDKTSRCGDRVQSVS